MPRSGFQANNHARVAADAVMARLTGQPVNAAPIIANTCYSFVSANGGHVGSVHKWNVAQKTLVPADGAGCLSAARRVHQADWAGADLPAAQRQLRPHARALPVEFNKAFAAFWKKPRPATCSPSSRATAARASRRVRSSTAWKPTW
jgi:hypothetical protein